MKKIVIVFLILSVICACTGNEKNLEETAVKVVRKGSVIMVNSEKLDLYKELHAHPWSGVLDKLEECNIRNYSIFYRDGYLFSYFEYIGTDFKEDMNRLAADSTIQAWWKLTDPCQEPVSFAKDGEWWADMEEVFHMD